MNKQLVLAAALAASVMACKSGNPNLRNEIGVKINATQPAIQKCYQNVLYTSRKVRGMMVLQMAANAEGQFIDVNTLRDEPANPVLRYCVVQELSKLRLDKAPGKRIEITSVPIKFEWSNP
ncbi:MAG TPA: AgmX/PglI C-terminal domain-containing protein [Kofleriaceae bacterium]|nr:AgmX/PglI C-terminal domain-containing protein [Kofleriaceae bacterium]